MILEELIAFERKELKSSQSFETRLVLTKNFFSKYPAMSKEKLKLFMDMLKDDQAQKAYNKHSYVLITFILFLLGFIALVRSSNDWKQAIPIGPLSLTLAILIVLLAVAKFIYRKRQRPGHQLLLQVMEHLYWQE